MPAFHLAQTNLVGRRHGLGLLLATFLVHLATMPVMATQDAQAEPTESPRRLDAGWDYRWGDVPVTGRTRPIWTLPDSMGWQPAPTTYNPPGARQRVLWLRIQLPEVLPSDPALAAETIMQAFEAYVDETRVYGAGVFAPNLGNKYVSTTRHFIPLPPDAGGRTLYLRIYSEATQHIGIPDPFYLVSETDYLLPLLRADIDEFVLGIIFVFIGLVCAYLLIGLRGEPFRMILAFGVLTFCLGAGYLPGSLLGTLLFAPALSYYMWGMLFFAPVGLMALHEQLIGPGPGLIVRRMWQAQFLFAAVVLLLDALNIIMAWDYFRWFLSLLAISVAVQVLTTIAALRRGEQIAKIYGGAMAVVLPFVLHDTIFLGFGNTDAPSLSPWGFLLFTLILAYMLRYRFTQTTRQLRQYADELEDRRRDLETANDQLAEYSNTLEQRVSERTADLRQAQDQLIHAEKMASMGQLTAGIAHEIKNPLNFVNNFAQLSVELADDLVEKLKVSEGRPPDDMQDLLADLKQNAERIHDHGRRADDIVRSMLDHSRGGAGERRAADVNELVEEYAELAYHSMRASAPGFNVTIEHDFDESVGKIVMAPREIGRVLLNLLTNAFYAVRERALSDDSFSPTVLVRTLRDDTQIEIHVSDNGPGIDEALRQKIFEPFFTTKPAGSGAGLGLSLSYDIVTQGHGGTLTLESEEGQGASFIVTLPVSTHTVDQSV